MSADDPEALSAEESLLKKIIRIEEEFVRISRDVSAGRFRDRWVDTASKKSVKI